MRLDSIWFIYLFLPAMLLAGILLPAKWRAGMLAVFTLLWYFKAEGANLWLLLGVLGFDYMVARLMEKSGQPVWMNRLLLACSVVKSLAIMAAYGIRYELSGTSTPLGLNVFCLTSMAYVLDCYYGFVPPQYRLGEFVAAAGFFPKLYAGPVLYGGQLLLAVPENRMHLAGIGEGSILFVQGLAKRVILGRVTLRLYQSLAELIKVEKTVLTAWLIVIVLAMEIYFNLSGYCDMARGLGKMFGMELPVNFFRPFTATSINDFFARFNGSFNKFIRRYVYINLGGTKGSLLSGCSNILLGCILMGLWFGLSLNLVAWGAFLAFFVMIERYCLEKRRDTSPVFLRWLYTFFVTLVSFAFVAGSSLSDSLGLLRLMFGMGQAVGWNKDVLYLLYSNYLLLMVSVACLFGLPGMVSGYLQRHLPRTWGAVRAVANGALLLVVTAFIIP